MICLGLDTALGACSVALADGETLLASAIEAMSTGHAEALAPMVDRVMRAAESGFDGVQRIAVTTGPGTFTGQRIGLAFARGLAVALKVPCVGLSTLEVMAAAAQAAAPGRSCFVASDARRGEAYVQGFAVGGEAIAAPQPLSLADAAEILRGLGPDVALAGTAIAELGEGRNAAVTQPDAVWVARLGQHRDPQTHPPVPLYLRAPDAKLPGPLKPLPAARAR